MEWDEGDGWKVGRREEVEGGRVEGWKGGRMEGWKDGCMGWRKKHNLTECATAVSRWMGWGEGDGWKGGRREEVEGGRVEGWLYGLEEEAQSIRMCYNWHNLRECFLEV